MKQKVVSRDDVHRRTREEAFGAFFSAENERLQRFAIMLVGDPHEAAELTQEALARVYARWGWIKSGSPSAYARQTILNLVRSGHRARKLRDAKLPPAWAAADVDQPGADHGVGDSMQILDALRALPPARRAAVILRFYEDLSDHEIARVLDRPVGTVKSDIHRALKQLRSLMGITSVGGKS